MNKNVHKGASLGSVQSALFDFATTWTTVHQASLSITNSQFTFLSGQYQSFQ